MYLGAKGLFEVIFGTICMNSFLQIAHEGNNKMQLYEWRCAIIIKTNVSLS